MPANMRELRGKVRSVENTRQITKAMKMVAAAKLRRAQERVEAGRPYMKAMKDVLSGVLQASGESEHPLVNARELVRRRAYCVITSDRGLAGGYNSGLLRYFEAECTKAEQGIKVAPLLFVVGRKGTEVLPQRGHEIHRSFVQLGDAPSFLGVRALAKPLVDGFIAGDYDELFLVYNRFLSAMVQQPTMQPLLPLNQLVAGQQDGAKEQDLMEAQVLYEYEPSPAVVLEHLLWRCALTQVYQAILDARASEFAARMNAMSQATDNATDVISSLRLQLNRARQAAITQEIAEIVGGAAAL